MKFTNKLIKLFTSPKTIIILILLTLTACLIGFFVPQIADKSPSFFETWQGKNIYTYRFITRLQLHQVYTSYWFLILVVLIAISLSYSLYFQVKKNLHYNRMNGPQNAGLQSQSLEKVRNVLHRRRFREQGFLMAEHKLIFTKNSFSRWGGVTFHAGLLLVVISAIMIACFQKRGVVQLIEGDTFDGKEESFLIKSSGVLAGEFNAGFSTYLTKLDHNYWDTGKLKHLESSLVIISEDKTLNQKLTINTPLLINSTTIYQSYDYGYTLSFSLLKQSGDEVISSFNFDRASDERSYTIGESDYPMSPYIFKMKFIPDLEKKTYYINKPIVHLNIAEGLNNVFSGLVIPGSAIKIKGDILQFHGVRYWSGLIYVKNPGMPIAYIGFAVVIIGITIMFLLPYKEIHVTFHPENQSPDVTGSTKRFNAIYKEEINEIKEEINIANA